MFNKTNIALALAVIAVLGLGYMGLVGGNQSGPATGISMPDTSNVTSFGIFPKNSTVGVQVIPATGSLSSATGTAFYAANPFGATSSVTFFQVNQTTALPVNVGAVTWTCGTTTVPGATPSATLASVVVASGTTSFFTPAKYSAGGGYAGNGNLPIGVGPNEYISCTFTTASSTDTASSWTQVGTYKLLFSR